MGASLWAVVVSGGGYLFGQTVEVILGDVRHYEVVRLSLVAVVGAAGWAFYLLRRRRNPTQTNL